MTQPLVLCLSITSISREQKASLHCWANVHWRRPSIGKTTCRLPGTQVVWCYLSSQQLDSWRLSYIAPSGITAINENWPAVEGPKCDPFAFAVFSSFYVIYTIEKPLGFDYVPLFNVCSQGCSAITYSCMQFESDLYTGSDSVSHGLFWVGLGWVIVCLEGISHHYITGISLQQQVGLANADQANTRHSPNAGLILVQRLRRWPSITPVLDPVCWGVNL